MESQLNRTGFVTIKKNLPTDLQVMITIEKYDKTVAFKLLSLVINENVIVEEDCDENGLPDRSSYKEPRYGACRMNGDVIEVCHDKLGWVPADEKLNEAYAEMLADKVLLEEKTNEKVL